jgi:thiamine-monophosphate kinase
MGAEPAWFTLSITLPEYDENWLEQFSSGLFDLARQHQIQLVGGDTTRGPLSITIQAMGLVPEGQALTRSGARVNDVVYVTGNIGDASAGLRLRQHEISTSRLISDALITRLERPSPRVAVGIALRGLASSVIDVSDGLGADLGHILSASDVGADISIDKIPLSDAFLSLAQNDGWQQAVNGGDDYELCFTVPAENEQQVQQQLAALDCRCTCIGTITSHTSYTSQGQGLRWLDRDGNEVNWNVKGYDHFMETGKREC